MRFWRLVLVAACVTWANVLAQDPVTPANLGTQGVAQLRPIKEILPVYPPIAVLPSQVAGRVVVEATITAAGRITGAQVVQSTSRLFDNAALDGIRQWTFEPVVVEGRAVPLLVTFVVAFGPGNGAAPAPKVSTAASPDVPRDFAFVYRYGCVKANTMLQVHVDSSREQLITRWYGRGSTSSDLASREVRVQLLPRELREVHREFVAAAALAPSYTQLTWMEPYGETVVPDDRIELFVTSKLQQGIETSIGSGGLYVNGFLDVRADGGWTRLWTPGSDLPPSAFELRVRALRERIERIVAAKDAVKRLPVARRSCPREG